MTKRFIILSALALLSFKTMAQTNGSNSPYSRYGLGTLDAQSQTFNRGMGGVSMGLRNGKNVNAQNPASYSAMDSLTFLFDIGTSLQYGHLTGTSGSVNVRNASLSNINAGFRAARRLGMSIGFAPFSSIGYNFQSTGYPSNNSGAKTLTTLTTYSGSGGIHQVYIGAGWNPFAGLSVGVNASYLWGEIEHNMSQVFYENSAVSSNYNTQNNIYSASINTYKVDFGLQYPIRINKRNILTLGATYSLGHKINNSSTLDRYTSASDTISSKVENAFSLPQTFGGGFSWNYNGQWLIAADYILEQWQGCRLPVAGTSTNELNYQVRTDQFMNRTQVKFGMEYTPDARNRNKYLQTVRYRLGMSYASPYTKVNGVEGPKEYRLTAGLGLPLQTAKLNGRSVVNVSAEWMVRKPSATNLIKENYLILNVGITFNERWFEKWKID